MLAVGGHGGAVGGAAVDLPTVGVNGPRRVPGSGVPPHYGDVANVVGLMIAVGGEKAAGRFDDGSLAAGADVGIDLAIAGGLAFAVEGEVAESFAVTFRATSLGWRGEIDGSAGIGDKTEESGVIFFLVEVLCEDLGPLPWTVAAGEANAVAVLAGVVWTGEPMGEHGAVTLDSDGGEVGPVDEPTFAAGDLFGGAPTFAGPFGEAEGVAVGTEGVDPGEVDGAVGAGREICHSAFGTGGGIEPFGGG